MRGIPIVATTLVAAGISSSALAQPTPPSCDLAARPGITMQLSSGDRERSYRLFVPEGVERRAPLPLVLDLHGSGGTAAGQARTSGFEALAAREGIVVASLQADGGRWNVPIVDNRADDVAYVSDVIDHVAAHVCVDQTRVYATGFSGGGRMTSLLGCRLNTRLAAIAPMAGLRWPGRCEGRPIPVLTLHGLADTQNPYQGQVPGRNGEWVESVPDALAGWAEHNGCRGDAVLDDPPGPLSTLRYEQCRGNADVRLIRIDGLGHTWARQEIDATDTMWQFFRRYTRPR